MTRIDFPVGPLADAPVPWLCIPAGTDFWTITRSERLAALTELLDGVELGAGDRTALAEVAAMEDRLYLALGSLLARARGGAS
ncbi:hypothetical protein [Allonocardiopsis opalescens]|uniref:Uncharacterized protein n=1 Tax=Allonocardiopsis opalescens TaxID=1144618 RepID=A0A2T0PP66_9ACTN|nr:hypothetical protein [Allonocardiopsis opalescens]PRX90692.1 hypothetical protein CLV72_11830 [Allonocardiopsis opalescens]